MIDILRKILSGLLLGAIAAGCVRQQTASEGKAAVDIPTVEFEEVTEFDFGQKFKNIHCVQLEATDESLLTEIKAIVAADSVLVVLDDFSHVYAFDRATGKFLNSIGSSGEGPGEYFEATDICLTPDKGIAVLDRVRRSIFFYDIDGRFVRKSKKIDDTDSFESFTAVGKTGFLICNNIFDGAEKGHEDGNKMYSFHNIDGTTYRFEDYSPLSVENEISVVSRRPLAGMGDYVSFLKCLNDTLFSIDEDRDIRPVLVLKTKKPMPDVKELSDYCRGGFDKLKKASYCRYTDTFEGFDKIYETDSMICLTPASWSPVEDTFWVDKNAGKGYVFLYMMELDSQYLQVLAGKRIIEVVGSSPKELFATLLPYVLKHVHDRYQDIEYFNEELSDIAHNVLAEGNPVVLIYEN